MKLTNHAVTQFQKRFYEVARLTDNIRRVIYSLVNAATERRKSWHPRYGNYVEYINGPLVAIVKNDVIITIIRRIVC